MKKMTYSQSIAILDPEFDNFLFAPIGEEINGLLLRVVSALARLGMDPWDEAANLAGFPRLAATERLTDFIAALSDRPAMELETSEIAAGLIARLLPQPAASVRVEQQHAGVAVPGPIQTHPFFIWRLF